MTRVVQRTPNLGLTLKMQRPGAAAAAEAPALGWWDPDAQSFTRQVETMLVTMADYNLPAVPRAVVASLCGAVRPVAWSATWQGTPLAVPGHSASSPDVFIGGNVACAVDSSSWQNRRSGVLQLWADHGRTRYGPITLVVTNDYYGP